MDEVVKMVTEKTGIPDDKARMAVQVVMDYLKTKMPGAVSGQLDSALSGSGGGALGGGLGGMLGGKP